MLSWYHEYNAVVHKQHENNVLQFHTFNQRKHKKYEDKTDVCIVFIDNHSWLNDCLFKPFDLLI